MKFIQKRINKILEAKKAIVKKLTIKSFAEQNKEFNSVLYIDEIDKYLKLELRDDVKPEKIHKEFFGGEYNGDYNGYIFPLKDGRYFICWDCDTTCGASNGIGAYSDDSMIFVRLMQQAYKVHEKTLQDLEDELADQADHDGYRNQDEDEDL